MRRTNAANICGRTHQIKLDKRRTNEVNMIKGKELLGRHVVDLNTGERVDSVRDIVFDHGANLVLGLVVDAGGTWLKRRDRVIPFAAVYSVGEDAVMITDVQGATSTEEQAHLERVMASKVNLIGMALRSESGKDLGRIADVVFDEYSGEVQGYEVTGGALAGGGRGAAFLPAPLPAPGAMHAMHIGKDAATVPDSVAEAVQNGRWPDDTGHDAAHDAARETYQDPAGERAQESERTAHPLESGPDQNSADPVFPPIPAAPGADDQPLDIGEYERRSEPASWTPGQPPEEAAPAREHVSLPEPEAHAPDGGVAEAPALVGTALIPSPGGGLEAVPVAAEQRPMRVREEQVVRPQTPPAGPPPSLLDRARRWLGARREDLLHSPEERELVQVHEEWGSPITAADTAPSTGAPAQQRGADAPPIPVRIQLDLGDPVPDPVSADAKPPSTSLPLASPVPMVTEPGPDSPVPLDHGVAELDQVARSPETAGVTAGVTAGMQEEKEAPVADHDAAPSTLTLSAVPQTVFPVPQPHVPGPGPAPSPAPGPASGPVPEPVLQPAPQPVQEVGVVAPSAVGTQRTTAPAPALGAVPAVQPVSADPSPVGAAAADPQAPGQQNAPGQPTGAEDASAQAQAFHQALDQIIQQAYGWPVTRTVQAATGEVVLAEGGRVTPAVVAEAKRLGALRELLSAVQRGE